MNLLIYLVFFKLFNIIHADPLTTWYTSSATLPNGGDFQLFVAYDESSNPDCIFLVGGQSCPRCVYCYNITNDELSYTNTLRLSQNKNFLSDSSSVTIGSIIYYITEESQLRKFDLSNAAFPDEYVLDIPYDDTDWDSKGRDICLTKNPYNKDMLYAVDGYNQRFYSINLELRNVSDYSNKHGTFLNMQRQWYYEDTLYNGMSCIINTYYDTPYLYSIGGTSVFNYLNYGDVFEDGIVESIGLMENNKVSEWQTVGFDFNSLVSDTIGTNTPSVHGNFSAVSYNEWIYLIGGGYMVRTGSNEYEEYFHENTIVMNVDDWSISYGPTNCYDGLHIKSIIAGNRIYVFGGTKSEDNSFVNISTICYSNLGFNNSDSTTIISDDDDDSNDGDDDDNDDDDDDDNDDDDGASSSSTNSSVSSDDVTGLFVTTIINMILVVFIIIVICLVAVKYKSVKKTNDNKNGNNIQTGIMQASETQEA